MDLQIQPTLLGEAFPGQHIEIDTKDGKTHGFICHQHQMHTSYIWLLAGQKSSMIEKVFPDLRATWSVTWRPSAYKIYVDYRHPIAHDCPLYLRAVVDGMGSAGEETSACLGAIAAIRIL